MSIVRLCVRNGRPAGQTWGTARLVLPQGGTRVTVINVQLDPEFAPSSIALNLSGQINAISPGGVACTYDVTIGIGETNWTWFGLAPHAIGAPYVVSCHSVMVQAVPAAAGTSGISCWASPCDQAPTLTPF